MFSRIDEDSIGNIFSYLTSAELGRACIAIPHVYSLYTVKYLWKQRCVEAWGYTDAADEILRLPFNGMHLISYTWPICDKLLAVSDLLVTISDLSVEYQGLVGESNRSVQAKHALPPVSPSDDSDSQLWRLLRFYMPKRFGRRDHKHKFSTPFLSPMSPMLCSLNLEPRSVMYFEVSISALDIVTEKPQGIKECIAVGLATMRDTGMRIMPGWDENSYGYHSDDGAIFHGNGYGLATYGPEFGTGDVVGCGIRYDTQEIFFTLNGVFLGYAFKSVQGSLHPTVGIDANVKLEFNFGKSPFVFAISDVH